MTSTAHLTSIALADEYLVKLSARQFDEVKTQLQAEGWPRYMVNEVEIEYRKLLTVYACFPEEDIVAPPFIARFWMQHMLNTRSYAETCQEVFERMLHHAPDRRRQISDDRQRLATIDLYKRVFPNGDLRYWVANDFTDLRTRDGR